MAAALLDREAQGEIEVRSAGSAPAGDVHPEVVDVMSEIGIDLSEAKPKPLSADEVQRSDVVITMGCGDACPVFPGKRYEDWAVADPSGKPLDEVRQIRDEIHRRVEKLAEDLLG